MHMTKFLLIALSVLFFSQLGICAEQCIWSCESFRGICPAECVERCVSSACSGNLCTDDCNGPGHCSCPQPGEDTQPKGRTPAIGFCLAARGQNRPDDSEMTAAKKLCERLLAPTVKKEYLHLEWKDQMGDTVLLGLARLGLMAEIETVIKLGADIKAQDSRGMNAVLLLARSEKCRIEDFLKMKRWGFDLTARTGGGLSLAYECQPKSAADVQFYLKENVYLGPVTGRATILQEAIAMRRVDVVRALLKGGIDPNPMTPELPNPPLRYTLLSCNQPPENRVVMKEIARLLIDAKARYNSEYVTIAENCGYKDLVQKMKSHPELQTAPSHAMAPPPPPPVDPAMTWIVSILTEIDSGKISASDLDARLKSAVDQKVYLDRWGAKIFDNALAKCRVDYLNVIMKYPLKPDPSLYDKNYMKDSYPRLKSDECKQFYKKMGWSK